MLVAILTFTLATYGLGTGKIPITRTALADAQRVVSLYVDGQKRIIPTDAQTVGDLLNRSHVTLGPGDIVEPDISTPIPEGAFYVNVYRSRPVVVIDGSQVTRGYSAYQNPKLILGQLGIQIYPEDLLAVAPVNDFVNTGVVGQQLTITRAKLIRVEDFDGNTKQLRTQAATVGDVLAGLNIKLRPGDRVSPKQSALVVSGSTITLSRVNQELVKVEEVIPHGEEAIRDPKLEVPSTAVEQAGSDGQKVTTYRVVYRNGQIVSKTPIKSEVTVQPKPRIVAKGSLVTANTWLKLRMCESSNNYADKYNPNYRGAYQFSFSTWASVGGSGDPANASPSEQDSRAQMLYNLRGWSPWVCANGW